MRIQLLSDVHVEMFDYEPEKLDADVVVLAGDIHTKAHGIKWATEHFSMPVLYVTGNHEYYGGHLDKTLAHLRAEAEKTNGKVMVLERDIVEIAGVRFLGATGWTDFSLAGNRVFAAFDAENAMSDFKKIRATPRHRKLRPADLVQINESTRDWFRRQLAEPYDGKTVVITHHAPLPESIPEWRRISNDELNPAYANDWSDEAFFNGNSVHLWLHGHIHNACDYTKNGVRVICNPRGYAHSCGGQHLVNDFNPGLIIDV